VPAVWKAAAEGRSGVGPISLFDTSDLPVKIAAEVRDWDVSAIGEDPAEWQRHPRQTEFAVASAVEAAGMAGIAPGMLEPARLGVYLGCGEVFQDLHNLAQWVAAASPEGRFQLAEFVQNAHAQLRGREYCEHEPNLPAHLIAARFDAQGPNLNCISACVSASRAIGESAEFIRRGAADVMLAGGAHSMITPIGLTGFHLLSVLTDGQGDPAKAMRPFDLERNGFVIGEGGAILVLEALEHAQRRGAEILAEFSGVGMSQDAYRLTDTHPDGIGVASAIRLALDDARLTPDDLDYLNAHGTSTKLNDKVETVAIKRALGDAAYKVPISSTKSMMGHSTTACGGIEAVVSLMAIHSGVIPPTINYRTPDPQCDLDYVPNTARELPCRHVLSNNLGFGGQNAALILSRFG